VEYPLQPPKKDVVCARIAVRTTTGENPPVKKSNDQGAGHRAPDFDALIIPGGYAPDRMRRHKAMVDLVRDVFARGKVVAAICHGAWMLVSADVLRGRKATCFFAIKDDLVNAGALYEDREVVRDGNLVTSRKPDDLPAFCRAILQALVGARA